MKRLQNMVGTKMIRGILFVRVNYKERGEMDIYKLMGVNENSLLGVI